jgi:hypothetical protein
MYRYVYCRNNSSAWWEWKLLTFRLRSVAINRQKQINQYCKLSPVARLTSERYSQGHVAVGHVSDISSRLRALLLAEGCWFNPEWVFRFVKYFNTIADFFPHIRDEIFGTYRLVEMYFFSLLYLYHQSSTDYQYTNVGSTKWPYTTWLAEHYSSEYPQIRSTPTLFMKIFLASQLVENVVIFSDLVQQVGWT